MHGGAGDGLVKEQRVHVSGPLENGRGGRAGAFLEGRVSCSAM